MPREGFFKRTELTQTLTGASLLPKCGACKLYLGCKSPKMPVSGQGRRKVMILGEAPGETEDDLGRPFVGRAGRHLREVLDKIGVDLDRDCWTTNALICRPPKNKTPTDNQVDWCRPNVQQTLRDLHPEVIIPLGKVAVRSLLGGLWRDDVGPMLRWVGWRMPCQALNAWVCPTWHPSFLIREENPVADRQFERCLRRAFKLKGRPWDEVPNHPREVIVYHVAEAACPTIAALSHGDVPVAFDYETTTLKPEGPHARIVTCSMSDGNATIAYPWHGEAVEATRAFLRSDVPKIASNMKFEERWSQHVFARGVRNWCHDTMLTAHALHPCDNRPGITSIKFQAFVRLGEPSWDRVVKPYLRSKDAGNNSPNRIEQVDLRSLLVYNGMDSLMEWLVAMEQRKELGFKEDKDE